MVLIDTQGSFIGFSFHRQFYSNKITEVMKIDRLRPGANLPRGRILYLFANGEKSTCATELPWQNFPQIVLRGKRYRKVHR